MNRREMLSHAMNAVGCQQTIARNHIRDAHDLNRPDLVEYWSKEVEKAEAVYQGLLNLMLETCDEEAETSGLCEAVQARRCAGCSCVSRRATVLGTRRKRTAQEPVQSPGTAGSVRAKGLVTAGRSGGGTDPVQRRRAGRFEGAGRADVEIGSNDRSGARFPRPLRPCRDLQEPEELMNHPVLRTAPDHSNPAHLMRKRS